MNPMGWTKALRGRSSEFFEITWLTIIPLMTFRNYDFATIIANMLNSVYVADLTIFEITMVD